MARILLGWELGANSGHAIKLATIGGILAGRGHAPVYAVQHIGRFSVAEVWQAPLWPSQIASLARPATVTPATMGDILVALGLAEPGALAALLGAWDRMLAAIRPDAIVADYAPALMLAAAGRVPVVSVGVGFAMPPGRLDAFPSLTGAERVHAEAPLLDLVNAALAGIGRPPLAALPAIFAATRAVPATFVELDPYGRWRQEPPGAPTLLGPVPPIAGGGDELFVYMSSAQARPAAFWQGLQQSGLKVRIHDPRLNAADREVLARAGFAVEVAPLPFARIAERSRLVLSHGGIGFTSSALLAGLPQIIVPYDIEKRLNARAVAGLGLGATMPIEGMEAAAFAALLRATAADAALAARTRAAAPAFRARMAADGDALAADAAEELAIR